MEKQKVRISLISKLNYFRLIYRSILLVTAIVLYVFGRINGSGLLLNKTVHYSVLGVITVFYVIEMIDRFFPTKTSSMGSQKQFKRNFVPTGETKPHRQPWYRTALVFGSWIALNGIFVTFYILNYFKVFGSVVIVDSGIMLLISLFYGICDMICILFFCPFQTWMMRNRCCGSCRIYNWDFMMMATPLIVLMFLPFNLYYSIHAIILVSCATILLIRWELTYRLHPERYTINTNASLHCVNCKEKLCTHKKQLRSMLRKSGQWLVKTLKEVKTKDDIYRKDQALGGRKDPKELNNQTGQNNQETNAQSA